jgi:DNA helicase-2/ATP-dependent DNA helicase PcrA
VTPHNVWATLAQRDTALPRVVRRIVYDHVLYGDASWNEPAWSAFVDALLPHFAPVPEIALRDLVDFVEFVVAQKADPADPERHATRQARFNEITLRLGSIHSVKGKSVDGILVVESEVWKGQARDQRCIDLTTVLPHAFGVRTEAFTGIQLASAASLLDAAVAQGWKIVDLGAIEPTGD